MPEQWTFDRMVSVWSDVVSACIFSILKLRGIYEPGVFIQKRIYDTSVWSTRNQELLDYVKQVVQDTCTAMNQGTITHMFLIILNCQRKPVERYVFDLEFFPGISESQQNCP